MDSVYSALNSSAAIVNNNGKQEIYVWGDNTYGQLGLGDTNNKFVPTLLDSSKLGNYSSIKELRMNSYTTYIIVSAIEGEQIYVWGRNHHGQLGIGNNIDQASPILFNTSQFGDDRIKTINFNSVAYSGAYASFAILSSISGFDKIYVWGYNEYGKLGLGDATDRLTPTLFDTTQFGVYLNIKEFSINFTSHAIIQRDANTDVIYLWGDNRFGQCVTGTNEKFIASPKELVSSIFNNAKIKYFDILYFSPFLILTRNGVDELYAWGFNDSGKLGNGNTTSQTSPFRIPQSAIGNASEIVSINSNVSTTALVRINGSLSVYVWGNNEQSQLGLGDANNRLTPVLLSNSRLGNFTEIYESSFNSKYLFDLSAFAYVKTPNGDQLYTWGYNFYGQLGLGGGTASRSTPTQVTSINLSGANIKYFSKFMNNAFLLTLDRNGQSESYATGFNNSGQLGIGNTTQQNTFTPILPTRYTNPQPKIMPTANLTSSQALELINPNNNLVRTELDKYVDTTSFPPGATLSIDPATTTSDYKNGILNLGIRTNQYNIPMVLATQAGPKTFNVTIPGFRPVTDVNTNPVSVIIRDADGNNIDKIYDQLVDSTYKVINRDLLEYYFDLSSIPPNAVIHLYRTSFGNDTEATFTLTASQVYGNNGLIVSNQLYVKTDLVWTFTSSQLNLALVISLSAVGGLLLIGAIIAIMLVRRSSNRLII